MFQSFAREIEWYGGVEKKKKQKRAELLSQSNLKREFKKAFVSLVFAAAITVRKNGSLGAIHCKIDRENDGVRAAAVGEGFWKRERIIYFHTDESRRNFCSIFSGKRFVRKFIWCRPFSRCSQQ